MNATGLQAYPSPTRIAAFAWLAALALSACTARLPVPTLPPTRTPPAASTVAVAAPASAATPAATGVPPVTGAQPPAPSPAPGQFFPLFTGEQYQLLDWSPSGRYLAFLSLSRQDLLATPSTEPSTPPLGTFQILDAETGKGCAYPQFNDLGLNFTAWHTWLPGDRLVITTIKGKLVALSQPCGGSLQIPTAGEEAAIHPDVPPGTTFSPGGSYRGYSLEKEGSYTLVVVNSRTGNSVASLPWKTASSLPATPPGPVWINDSTLLLPQTVSGPILVSLDQTARVQPVGPMFFQLPASRRQVAAGASVPGSAGFSLALSDLDPLDNLRRIWLYHSQDGRVEKLPFAGASFSEDGGMLFLTDDMGFLWVRPVEPSGSPPLRLTGERDQPSVALHPIRPWAAIASQPSRNAPASIRLVSLPDGVVQRVWQPGEQYGVYHYNALSWSPDGRYLAAIGSDPTSGEQQALFLLPYSGSLPKP